MKKFKRERILTATSSFQVEWSNWGSYGKTAHFSFKWAKPTLLHSFYTVLPIFYFTMLPVAQFSTAKVWLWIIIIIIKSGGWIVIYNPTKNPIKLEENRCSPNAYTFYKNNLNQICRAGARRKLDGPHPVKKCVRKCAKCAYLNHSSHAQSFIRAFTLHSYSL